MNHFSLQPECVEFARAILGHDWVAIWGQAQAVPFLKCWDKQRNHLERGSDSSVCLGPTQKRIHFETGSGSSVSSRVRIRNAPIWRQAPTVPFPYGWGYGTHPCGYRFAQLRFLAGPNAKHVYLEAGSDSSVSLHHSLGDRLRQLRSLKGLIRDESIWRQAQTARFPQGFR